VTARPDAVALVVGLLALLLAGLGLWSALGTVNWSWVGVAAPLSLVALGLIGLAASRTKP